MENVSFYLFFSELITIFNHSFNILENKLFLLSCRELDEKFDTTLMMEGKYVAGASRQLA